MAKGSLEGLRVVFIGSYWAGPMCASAMADMGAKVIKVETHARIDNYRYLYSPEGNPERGPLFLVIDRNLLSVTINFTRPEGAALVKKIIKVSDVMLDNLSPRVLQKSGLTYDAVRQVNPEIVMASLSGYGQTGPVASYSAFGPHLSGLSGLSGLIGYEGDEPIGEFQGYNDPAAGLTALFAIMAALRYRAKTGKGQYIDVSEWEVGSAMMGQEILDYTMNGRVAECQGNRSSWMAPHGCYRCQGEDKWITIACATEDEWRALCRATGNLGWMKDNRFADAYARLKNKQELDELVSEWTLRHTDYEVMGILQEAGVAAVPVFTISELFTDPHAQAEEYLVHLPHPHEPGSHVYNNPWKLSETPPEIRRYAPLFGEHNEHVLRELCGMSKDEFDKLVEDRVIW